MSILIFQKININTSKQNNYQKAVKRNSVTLHTSPQIHHASESLHKSTESSKSDKLTISQISYKAGNLLHVNFT